MDKEVQKVQNSSYKINRSWGEMYRMVTLVNNPSDHNIILAGKHYWRPNRCQALC